MPKREKFIDYGKALMIVLVVMAHSGISSLNNISHILMSYFFMVSGYCYTKGKRPIKENIKLRFQKLIVLYWIAMFVYAIFEIYRASTMGYGDASIFIPGIVGLLYGSGHNLPLIPGITDRVLEIMSYKYQDPGFVDVILPTNCHLWFLPAMFCGSVLFFFFVEKIYKTKKDLIWYTILMVLLASTETLPFMIQLPYGLGRGFFACACMIVGYELKEQQYLNSEKNHTVTYIILAALAVGFYFLGARQAALVRSVYGPYGMLGTFITFISGASACVVILALLKKLERFDLPLIENMGRNSVQIYTWHMVFLTIFSILMLPVFGVEMARDEFFMSIIPEDHKLLIILVGIIAIACCNILIEMIKKRNK